MSTSHQSKLPRLVLAGIVIIQIAFDTQQILLCFVQNLWVFQWGWSNALVKVIWRFALCKSPTQNNDCLYLKGPPSPLMNLRHFWPTYWSPDQTKNEKWVITYLAYIYFRNAQKLSEFLAIHFFRVHRCAGAWNRSRSPISPSQPPRYNMLDPSAVRKIGESL